MTSGFCTCAENKVETEDRSKNTLQLHPRASAHERLTFGSTAVVLLVGDLPNSFSHHAVTAGLTLAFRGARTALSVTFPPGFLQAREGNEKRRAGREGEKQDRLLLLLLATAHPKK